MPASVIAGRAHGRRRGVPPGGLTRPNSGLVHGALITMVEQRGWLAGATVPDLFADSGALGIEALSRGAEAAIFSATDQAAVVQSRRHGRTGITLLRRQEPP